MRNKNSLAHLAERLERAADSMERTGLMEYLEYRGDHRKMLLLNLAGGIARGLGMAIGFTLLGAVVVYLLQRVAKANLPLIGNTIAEIVGIVNSKLK